MTCQQLIEFLTEYLEGQLPLSQRAAFELHLAICGQCRAYLHNFKATIEVTQKAFSDSTVEAPASVPEELVQAILKAREQNI
jgi:anti-sigma factor RsiW